MFSDLDDFLNDGPSIPTNTVFVEASPSTKSIDDSVDLDLSFTSVAKSIKTTSTKEIEPEEYVPAKGQKGAARRLNKLKKTIAEQLQSPTLELFDAPAKSKKRPSPNKTSKKSSKHTRKQIVIESSDAESDSENGVRYGRGCRNASSSGNSHHQAHASNVIVLDCDDAFIGGPEVRIERDLAAAPACTAEDNAALKINVRINGNVESYDLRRFQKFSELAAQIATQKSVPAEHIMFMFREKIVRSSESPDSISYLSGMVISAHINDSLGKSNLNNNTQSANKPKEGQIEIKIQNAGRKKPFVLYVDKTDKLKRLACEIAEEYKCDITKIRLEFDGEMVQYDDTPEDLDLEGGEIFDLFITK